MCSCIMKMMFTSVVHDVKIISLWLDQGYWCPSQYIKFHNIMLRNIAVQL